MFEFIDLLSLVCRRQTGVLSASKMSRLQSDWNRLTISSLQLIPGWGRCTCEHRRSKSNLNFHDRGNTVPGGRQELCTVFKIRYKTWAHKEQTLSVFTHHGCLRHTGGFLLVPPVKKMKRMSLHVYKSTAPKACCFFTSTCADTTGPSVRGNEKDDCNPQIKQ